MAHSLPVLGRTISLWRCMASVALFVADNARHCSHLLPSSAAPACLQLLNVVPMVRAGYMQNTYYDDQW